MCNITTQKLDTDLSQVGVQFLRRTVDPLFQKMSAAFDEGGRLAC